MPHHLLDLVDPDEDSPSPSSSGPPDRVLADIAARGRHALLVGGTGLYLRAVVDDLRIPGPLSPRSQAALERELDEGRVDVPELHARLAVLDPVAAERMEPTNRRRVVRALEVTLGSGQPFSSFGPGLEAYPPSPVPDDRPRPSRPRRSTAASRALRRAGSTPACSTRCGPWPPAPPGSRGRPARRWATGSCWPTSRRARPWTPAWKKRCAAPGPFARRQASWFRRDPRIVWTEPGVGLAELLDRALGAHGARP